MFKYGILTLLIVSDYLIGREEYEECQKIEDAFKKAESNLKIKIERNISKNVIDDLKSDFTNLGVNQEPNFGRYLVYAETVLNELGYSQIEIVFDEISFEEF